MVVMGTVLVVVCVSCSDKYWHKAQERTVFVMVLEKLELARRIQDRRITQGGTGVFIT